MGILFSSPFITSIVHSTSVEGYNGIIILNQILDQSDRKDLNIYLTGEGTGTRVVGEPRDLLEKGTIYADEVDEAKGVYFRIGTVFHPQNFKNLYGDIHFVFNDDLLHQYPNWIINTEENFGFFIEEHGIQGKSQFSGEEGTTWNGIISLEGIKQIRPDSSELLIQNSVNFKNLKKIIFRNRKIFDKVKIHPNNIPISFLNFP